MPLPARPERRPRGDGDPLLGEELERELRRGELQVVAREDIDRAFRVDVGKAGEVVQATEQLVAPLPELLAEGDDPILPVFQGPGAGLLDERRDAGDRVLDDPDDARDRLLRSEGEPGPPAAHRVGLREAADRHDGQLGRGHAAEGNMGPVVDQFRVRLVAQNRHVVVSGDLRRGPQLVLPEHPTGRVAGGDQHQDPRLGGDRFVQGVQVERMVVPQRESYGAAAAQTHRLLEEVRGVGEGDLVARVDRCG